MNSRIPPRPTLLTIGHSDHELPEFLSLLSQHEISAIADVRSQPYSRFHPQYNREVLSEALSRAGVQYVFLGNELGARRTERESYRDRQARYDLISKLPAFRAGLDRLRNGVSKHRIALLCAEKDPLTCHRTILVSRCLRHDPFDILHVLEDGSTETTEQAETRLLDVLGLPQGGLFQSRAELIEQAYDMQSLRIAFTESDQTTPSTEAFH